MKFTQRSISSYRQLSLRISPDPISFHRKLSPPKHSHIWKVSHIPGRTSLTSRDVSPRSSQSESGVYKRSVISSFRFFSYHRKSESMFSNFTDSVRNLAESSLSVKFSSVASFCCSTIPAVQHSCRKQVSNIIIG